MYQNIATKVLTGEVRLSYVNLTTPRAPQQGGEPKYSVTLLIPKTDAATIADINASIKAAYEAGVASKWAGKHPTPKQIVHDGDGLRPSGLPFGDECKGHWVLTASTKSKPQVVGIDNLDCELAPSDIYSGMYARVTINFFTYDTAGSRGVGCGLGNVLKTRDGEALAGGASAASDFEGLGQSFAAQPAAVPGYPQAQPAAPAYQPQYNPVTPQQAAPQAYAAPQPQAAPAQPQNRPAVNPITGQPW